MSKKAWLIVGTVAVLAVEAAVGTLISPTVALWLLVIFVPLGALAYLKVIKAKDITPIEVREFQHKIRKRKTYLPQLQQALDALLQKQYELADEAGKLSLYDYRDKYLKLSTRYRIMTSGIVGKLAKRWLKDEKMIILTALKQDNLIKKNPYILELEAKDDYKELWREYNKWYSKTYERPLRSLVAKLIEMARTFSSVSAIAQVARREFIRKPRNLVAIYNKEAMLKRLLEYQHKQVNDEFRELLEDGK